MPPRPAHSTTHVIYDLDGTLLDTEPMYIETTNRIFARHGMVLPPEVRALMIGRPSPIAVPLMLERTGLPMTAEQFVEEREQLLAALFPEALPMRGARELTDHLHAHAIPQAIATSSSPWTLRQKVQSDPEWFGRFATIVSSDDVPRGKPAPDIFLEAARRMGGEPSRCIVFEDAPAGVEAGLAAGMTVIAVPEPGHEDLVSDAHAVLESLEEFDPGQWGLPSREVPRLRA